MGRLDAAVAVIALLTSCPGCGLGPRNFRKINHPAPLVRARAVGLGSGRPHAEVIPILVARLNDPDVVVRMAAHEELEDGHDANSDSSPGPANGNVPMPSTAGVHGHGKAASASAGTVEAKNAAPAQKELAQAVAAAVRGRHQAVDVSKVDPRASRSRRPAYEAR